MLEYRTPSPGSHTGREGNSSDGATANPRRAPAHKPEFFNHDTPFSSAQHGFSTNPHMLSPYYTKLLPDWDAHKVIPKPTKSFIVRLSRAYPPTDRPPSMKIVNSLYRTFKDTFQGDRTECWARHINKLEAEVLDPNSFEPKQVFSVSSIRERPFG